MNLLTKINEFAKQRSIYLIVIHLQWRCFAGRETALAILQNLIFLLPQNPPNVQLVVDWWSKRVWIKPSTTSYVIVYLSVKWNWWSSGRFFRHRVCVCVRTCACMCARMCARNNKVFISLRSYRYP